MNTLAEELEVPSKSLRHGNSKRKNGMTVPTHTFQLFSIK